MNYKDPAFSVMLFFIIVLLSIIIGNLFSKWQKIKRDKNIKTFLDNFQFMDNKEILNILSKTNVDSILLLALSFENSGSYEKALNIYISVLDFVDNRYEILLKVAKLYLKMGFLHKSQESLYTILKNNPRNKEALKLLIYVNDKLQKYDEVLEIIEILDILKEDIKNELSYVKMKLYKQSLKYDYERLKELYKENNLLDRFYFEELLRNDLKRGLEEINDIYKFIDLLWSLKLPNNEKFCNLLAAKHLLKCEDKAPFEIEVLKNLDKEIAELNFEYICKECKTILPIHDYRCPKCLSLFSLEVEMKLTPKQ